MQSVLTPLEYLERFVRGDRPEAASAREFFRAWVADDGADPQMAAWMAGAAHGGVDDPALFALVSELVASGQRLELASLGPVGSIVGTGALGDAVVLTAIPLAAALGVRVFCDADEGGGVVPGLGEQLAAVPGYLAGSALAPSVEMLTSSGCVATQGLDDVAPAAHRLSVLAVHTGLARVPEVVAATAVARALALGAPAACLHVPYGPGARIPDREGAERVGAVAAAFAGAWGRKLPVVFTEVHTMIAPAMGHAATVREAGAVLRGEGSPVLRQAATAVAGALAQALEVGDAEEAAKALANGRAAEAADHWASAHLAQAHVWTPAGAPELAPHERPIVAAAAGQVRVGDVAALGAAVRRLGAGRLHPFQSIDNGVGIVFAVAPGEEAASGELIATVYGRDAYMADLVRDEVAGLLGARGA